MSIYVQSNQIISELRCHRNLLTSSKAVPLCLKQVLVVRRSLIQISDTRTSFLTILRFLCVIFFIICHDFNPSVWHTQRMTNFVTIFLWRFFAPVWHSLNHGHMWGGGGVIHCFQMVFNFQFLLWMKNIFVLSTAIFCSSLKVTVIYNKILFCGAVD